MHGAIVAGARTAGNVCEAGVGIHKRGLDLERRRLIHSMPVDDVGDLEAGDADFADALELVTEVVAVLAQLIVDVRKDAVALALADVERLAVARVNEPVNVGLELGHHIRWEGFSTWH